MDIPFHLPGTTLVSNNQLLLGRIASDLLRWNIRILPVGRLGKVRRTCLYLDPPPPPPTLHFAPTHGKSKGGGNRFIFLKSCFILNQFLLASRPSRATTPPCPPLLPLPLMLFIGILSHNRNHYVRYPENLSSCLSAKGTLVPIGFAGVGRARIPPSPVYKLTALGSSRLECHRINTVVWKLLKPYPSSSEISLSEERGPLVVCS